MTAPTSPFLTFDTHIDIPWPDQADMMALQTPRKVDYHKSRKGGLTTLCLAAYIPQGPITEAGHAEAFERARAMLTSITELEKRSTPETPLSICRTAESIIEARKSNALAIVPVIENGYALGTNVENVGFFARNFGIRYITLTHNGHNAIADAAIAREDLGDTDSRHGGLSSLGREMIQAMNDHGVLIDVSHAARSTMMQAAEASSTPIVASHSCARALCDHPRNLDDEQLLKLRDTGGVIQITAMGSFLRKGGGGTLEDLVSHVRYVADKIGVSHVGVSSDFDGGGGIEGWNDASQTAHVTHALQRAGFHGDELNAVWGGNMLRLLHTAETKAQSFVPHAS
ncbi:dipeptidase [Neokomagataea thailandica NBRC 106555]|uniref:Membrane dipeptidase n=2 Tax=Neokomagataea TaxID=1223423 RepID=A0A4Y6VA72_9PROT|nr:MULTISPECIES: dipeptidase [Neokomagataea]QDH25600.1 membrane dipeptidase [Neokomagataea tanensis]GBR52571.1 dipeptidase [Neokomagataea thailandica NBRC 106555]